MLAEPMSSEIASSDMFDDQMFYTVADLPVAIQSILEGND
uniref:Uncharacterized protein n=1 Tax=Ciona intestinalis TaxID=7719 RepID=H2XNF8_CIOIN